MPEEVKRRYESPRRRAQADATRRDIIAAAQRLFERQGYAATTMAAIAAEAGVALKTVYLAFETKSGVLRAPGTPSCAARMPTVPSPSTPGTWRCSRRPTRTAACC